MNKKTLIVIVVVLLALVAMLIFYFKPTAPKQEVNNNNNVQQEVKEVTQEDLDKTMTTSIESLKTTCVDFLKGELSGNPNSDCPGFDEYINRDLCFYCYATQKQDQNLCEKIKFSMAFKVMCQKVTGASGDK
jgi:uncharacterized protein (UPF0305 family)